MQPQSAAVSPETAFILRCVRAMLPAGAGETGPEPGPAEAPVADWDVLLDRARRMRAVACLRGRVAAAGAPDAAVRAVEQRFLGNVARNARLAAALREVIAVLSARGIPALAVKGVALAARAYGDAGSREADDLDFLVRRADQEAACRALADAGFVPQMDLSPAEAHRHLRAGWGCGLLNAQGDICVEIGCGVTPWFFSFEPDAAALWDRPDAVVLDGTRIPMPSRENHVLLLCAHGAKHRWERPGWIADVAGLIAIADPPFDCDVLLRRARDAGGLRMVLLGLALAADRMGSRLPDEVARAVAADRAVRTLAADAADGWDGRAAGSLMRFHLAARERTADRVRYLARLSLIPSHGDWRWVRLPEALHPLYYLLRPVRLVAQAAAWAMRRTKQPRA